jgi:CRISPR-associated protein Csb2
MAIAITVSFPRGRFHATPWNQHVNEGITEWPPSPWRLLRALVAVWRLKCPDLSQAPDAEMLSVIRKLAATAPLIKLPPASTGHTRHYMPAAKTDKPTLIFDAFVSIASDEPVAFVWPQVELEVREAQALETVLARLTYFGRAESWCVADLHVDGGWQQLPGILCGWIDSRSGEINSGETVGSGLQTRMVRTLVPDNDHPDRLRRWDAWSYKQKTADYPDPLWNLLVETGLLHKERWSDPAGAKWLLYVIPEDALTSRSQPRSTMSSGSIYQVARYALDGTVLPLVTETIYVAETARRYLQGIFGALHDGAWSPVFSGKTADGQPVADNHQHAFYLPSDEDGDGRLDHLTIVAAEGFGARELRALDKFVALHGPAGTQLRLLLTGVCSHAGVERVPLFATASVWRSLTPFIATRHYKERGAKRDHGTRADLPETVLREELARRGFALPQRITRLNRCELGHPLGTSRDTTARSLSWLEFRRQRLRGGGRRGSDPGTGFLLEFPAPVRGPVALGYGCHFGLGLFGPVGLVSSDAC